MNIVYFIWASNKKSNITNQTITNQTAHKTMLELGVSILSLKKHSENVDITVYIPKQDEDSLSYIFPFLAKQNCNVKIHNNKDENGSLFIKFLCFREALDDFDSFMYLDTDTLIVNDIHQLPRPNPLYFTPYEKFVSNKHSLTKKQHKFLKKHFHLKKPFKYINSHLMHVNQNIKCKFWQEFRDNMDKIIGQFKENCDGRRTDEMSLNDELYFTMALQRMKKKPKVIEFHNLIKYVRHGKRFRRSPNRIKYEKKVLFE